MTSYRQLPTASSCPDVDWFKDLSLPEGRTFVCIGREKIRLDQIERTNANGQVVNIARALGTNKENVQDLANNIKINGVLLDAQPPFVGTNFQLFDGFTRTEGIIGMGLEYWVFNVVEPKEGFTWSDVWDEIGLGANNHPPSKPATRQDFSKGLARWIALQEQEPTQGNCVDWINNIPHSFSQEIVSNIAKTTLNSERARQSMESVESKDVIARVSGNFTNRVEIIPINISGNDTYVKRAIFQALKAVSNPKKDMIRGVGYLKDVPAEKAEETRKAGIKLLNEYNDMFEEAFQQRLKVGAKYRLIDVDYIYPQIIDVETDLIPVKKSK